MSRAPWQKRPVEFATRQKLAQETEVSQELNGQMGSFCCQDQAVCNFFAHCYEDFLQTTICWFETDHLEQDGNKLMLTTSLRWQIAA